MTNFRNSLIDRMIHLYGFESPIVIAFAHMCETWKDNEWTDKILAALVASNEDDPMVIGE